MKSQCPGSLMSRTPAPINVKCQHCSQEVEIWTDEAYVLCPNCKNIVTRKDGSSCLDWCKFAKQCVGDEAYNKYYASKAVMIKQKLLDEVEIYFKDKSKSIVHAKTVLGFTEVLLKKESGDWHIIMPAAILNETESASVARNILIKIGLPLEQINEICDIISRYNSQEKSNIQNFKVLYDANLITNLKDKKDLIKDKIALKEYIEKEFFTNTAKKLAGKIYRI